MGIIWLAAAAYWGAAKASFFFVVPDVLLTLAAVRFGLRAGLRLSVIAAAAATLGGLAMWWWGNADQNSARHAMLLIPAVSPQMLARAHNGVETGWFAHLFAGSLTGLPYKLYAVEAGARGINPILFVLASFAARLTRFAITVSAAALTQRMFSSLRQPRMAVIACAAFWVALYTVYWVRIAPLG